MYRSSYYYLAFFALITTYNSYNETISGWLLLLGPYHIYDSRSLDVYCSRGKVFGDECFTLDSFSISNLGQHYFDSKMMTNPNRHSRAAFLCERQLFWVEEKAWGDL